MAIGRFNPGGVPAARTVTAGLGLDGGGNLGSNITLGLRPKPLQALNNAGDTLTAAFLMNSGSFTITPGGAVLATMDTGANIETAFGALATLVAGSWFDFTILNSAAFNVTLTAAAGVTLGLAGLPAAAFVINAESRAYRCHRTGAGTYTILPQ